MPKNSRSEILKNENWEKVSPGQYRSSGTIKEIKDFELYLRKTKFDDFLKKASKKVCFQSPESPVNSGFPEAGSNAPFGKQKADLTPASPGPCLLPNSAPDADSGSGTAEGDPALIKERNSAYLPALADFTKYPSLKALRRENPTVLIAFDSEWENLETGREMLSWQFAVIWNGFLYEFCFLKNGKYDLSLEMALGCILDKIGIKPVDDRLSRQYEYCTGWEDNKAVTCKTSDYKEACENAVYVYRDGIFTHERISGTTGHYNRFHIIYNYTSGQRFNVTLLCHTGKVDISALSYTGNERFTLSNLSHVRGGVVTMDSVCFSIKSLKNVNNSAHYPVTFSVSDTLCHAPGKKKRLEDLGNVIGIDKVDIPIEKKEHMKAFLEEDPVGFMEYASTDSVVTLMYASSLYGYNNSLPVTMISAAVNAMKDTMMEYLKVKTTKEFNFTYRGLKRVIKDLMPRDNRPGYLESSVLEPVSDDANNVQQYTSYAYHGGYNSCSEVGYFGMPTFDFDLQNAYPTAMCLVPDINWRCPIRETVVERALSIDEWEEDGIIDPFTPFVGYVSFEFPESVKYPCIPVHVESSLVYPSTSMDLTEEDKYELDNAVHAAGPLIYLALRLGAKVYCKKGYFLNVLMRDDHTVSRSISYAVKQLVEDRNLAKKNDGKGSLAELILKEIVNSMYGKNAQNVIQKNTWSAYDDEMKDIGCSAITNPFSAMMITSIVQAELLAAMNQLHDLGYFACSVTTDGFITNSPEDVVKGLDLYGLSTFMRNARTYLTGDPELWEMKHCQDDLVNIATRGNISLYNKDTNPYIYNGKKYDGVCAHNGAKSEYVSESSEDRLWFMENVLSRDGKLKYVEEEWTSFKKLVNGAPFKVTRVHREKSMDYDLKRKPDWASFRTDIVELNGKRYEIAHFDTVPFRTIREYKTYSAVKDNCEVLRTEADWEKFKDKLELNHGNGRKVREKEWAVLNSCVMGYRTGRWNIPGLSECGTVREKCNWINKFNSSSKVFKESDWKNARRPERQNYMLDEKYLEDKLREMREGRDFSDRGMEM